MSSLPASEYLLLLRLLNDGQVCFLGIPWGGQQRGLAETTNAYRLGSVESEARRLRRRCDGHNSHSRRSSTPPKETVLANRTLRPPFKKAAL